MLLYRRRECDFLPAFFWYVHKHIDTMLCYANRYAAHTTYISVGTHWIWFFFFLKSYNTVFWLNYKKISNVKCGFQQ